MTNTLRWFIVLGLCGLSGCAEIFSDATFPGWWALARHFCLGLIPAAIALRMRLDPDWGGPRDLSAGKTIK